jgi:predicted metal-binding membrane protein
MFATGAGSLLWMLLLTGVMVAEKTTNWGGRLAAPAGIALIAAGLATAGIALFTPL